jgi:hypothetical protein
MLLSGEPAPEKPKAARVRPDRDAMLAMRAVVRKSE